MTAELIAFTALSALSLWYSRASLRRPVSHGYYRFFAWEGIAGLVALNLRTWFADPLSWHQLISWLLLVVSLVPLVAAVRLLRSEGRPEGGFEATTHLVTIGIYGLIRHPMYASLLCLAWGIFFKSPSLVEGLTTGVVSVFLYATARADERECQVRFGRAYTEYMTRTRRFIPFVF